MTSHRDARDSGDLLRDLNEQQRAAVEHQGTPLLVVAGPGSGKTRVITHRIGYRILSQSLKPAEIMALTFTQRAAAELRSRLAILIGESDGVRAGTFHWMCNGLLRRYGDAIDLPRNFVLLTPREARGTLASMLGTLPLKLGTGAMAAAISAIKNGAAIEREAARRRVPTEQIQAAIKQYEIALRKQRALDLDDLLVRGVQLLTESETVRHRCQNSLSELLIDEYQDTNPVQERLLVLLAPNNGCLVAVGDEDQAIYGWRQAHVGTNRQFLYDFPDGRVITLDQSYRNSKHVLRAASSLIARNSARTEKPLRTENPAGPLPVCFVARDERDEAEWIASEIRTLHDSEALEWQDTAILYRVNAQSRGIEDHLVQAGIPYHVLSGRRFYDRPEIRLVVDYLRLALDWTDDAAASHLLSEIPGIGTQRLESLQNAAFEVGKPLADSLEDESLLDRLPVRLRATISEIGRSVRAVYDLRERSAATVAEVAIQAVASAWDGTGDPAEPSGIAEELEELGAVIREMTARRATLRDLVDRLSLEPDAEDTRQKVSLLSIHAAKGLEFRAVFIAGVEDGLLPHRRSLESATALEEERRLAYVGITRAAERLYLSYAHVRFLGGQALANAPSRFLADMGPANVEMRFSQVTAARPRLHSATPGDRVLHPRWKAGTIHAVEGTGRNTLVTITFDAGGRQRLQLCHAPLIKIGEEPSRVNTS